MRFVLKGLRDGWQFGIIHQNLIWCFGWAFRIVDSRIVKERSETFVVVVLSTERGDRKITNMIEPGTRNPSTTESIS